MNKQECIIIKDLLPNYIKNLTSVEVNEFIEKHISECHSCKEFLGELEREYQKQTLKDNILEQEEIDCLKKYRKKMRTLLLTLVSFIGGLLVIVFTVLGIKYKYNKYIITSVYDKLNEISNIENFKIGITDKHINFENNTEDTFSENIYYIDGKYREQHNEINTNREILNMNTHIMER